MRGPGRGWYPMVASTTRSNALNWATQCGSAQFTAGEIVSSESRSTIAGCGAFSGERRWMSPSFDEPPVATKLLLDAAVAIRLPLCLWRPGNSGLGSLCSGCCWQRPLKEQGFCKVDGLYYGLTSILALCEWKLLLPMEVQLPLWKNVSCEQKDFCGTEGLLWTRGIE